MQGQRGNIFKCFPVGRVDARRVDARAGSADGPSFGTSGPTGKHSGKCSPTRLSQRRGNISAPARRGNIPDPADGETFQNVSPSGPPRRGNILDFSGFQAEMFPRRWDPRPRGMFPRRPGRPPAPAECSPVPRIWVTAPTGKHSHNVSRCWHSSDGETFRDSRDGETFFRDPADGETFPPPGTQPGQRGNIRGKTAGNVAPSDW